MDHIRDTSKCEWHSHRVGPAAMQSLFVLEHPGRSLWFQETNTPVLRCSKMQCLSVDICLGWFEFPTCIYRGNLYLGHDYPFEAIKRAHSQKRQIFKEIVLKKKFNNVI